MTITSNSVAMWCSFENTFARAAGRSQQRVKWVAMRVACATLGLLAAFVCGVSADTLNPAVKAASELPRLYSLIVAQRGNILLERYFNGRRATTPANVKSVSKSVISALVGIAVDRKLLSLDQPIAKYFPELPEPKRAITIEDLLTMQSGLESTSNRNYGAWVQSSNWVGHALAKPLLAAPGTQMIYSTGNSHILSAVLTKATGKSTLQFAQEALAKPLGFTLAPWMRDPQGIYFGGNDMLMTPRQMLAFGELYRNGGQTAGRQLLSRKFLDETFEPRGRSRISGREYGYGWWIRDIAGPSTTLGTGRKAYYAWGFGGQYIYIVPSLDLTVVSTSSPAVSEDRRDHRRTVEDIIEHLIVAVLD
jgi:CubicO group peptidase (beta-lactamase class C family)